MPDLERITQSFVLDFKKPVVNRLKVVNGDTANTFVITLKNGGQAVQLNANLHKVIAVFERADGQVYTQDASTGLTFTTAGVVTIDLRPASFRSGTNTVELQVYKRANTSATTYPLLATTYPQAFTARNETLTGEGENAPSQLPMLEQIIHDAGEAVTACAAATLAANLAAETLNGMLANIDDEPTNGSNNLVKSGGVYAFATELVQDLEEDHLRPYTTPLMDGDADIGGTTHQFAYEDHVHPHDTTKQNVLTFDDDPTQNSNNPVKSGGIWYALEQKQDILVLDNAPTHGSDHFVTSGTVYDAIDAAAKKNFYNVKHDTTTWINGKYQTYTDDLATELAAIAADSVFSSQVELPSGKVVTVYETHRHNDMVYFKSETIDNVYVTAEMLLSASGQSQLPFTLHTDESPLTLHVSTITFDEANPLEFADEYDILSVDFAESKQTLFDAIGVRPIEVILPFGDKYYRLHTIGTFIDEGQQRTEKTVELTAAGDLLRTVPGALSNAYMSLTVTPHAPGYLLNASGYVVITES